MRTVPNRTRTCKPVAFYATMFLGNVGTSGIALRDGEGHVYFRAESTGVWTQLVDTDAPDRHLHKSRQMLGTSDGLTHNPLQEGSDV